MYLGVNSARGSACATGWHRDYSTNLESWANEQQKRKGWEMRVRIEKIIVTVLHEAHKRQVEETMETLAKGPEGLYKRLPYK